jgi:hypothetical protein
MRDGCMKVEDLLLKEGPCLSSRLCQILEGQGLTPEAARQRISRAGGAVKRLQGLVFPRGVRFFYHQSDFNSDRYWDALIRNISQASPAYAPAIASLKSRGGIVPLSHFEVISGAPILQKGQVASATVLERLKHVRILEQREVPGVGDCISLDCNGRFPIVNEHELAARLLTEKILLLAVKDWARKLGVASYDKILVRDETTELPKVGTFRWDLTGPSYLTPMVRRDASGKPKPGFFVCDVVAGTEVDEQAIGAFLRKCQLLMQLRRVSPTLPLLIANRFTQDAFKLARSRGILTATPGNLFGKEVAQGLASLLTTLTKAAAIASQNPAVIGELFDKLSGIEGAAANLRGALFEMLVAHCVQKLDDGSIDINKILVDPSTGKSAEVDVFRVKEHREVWCYECKGYQPTAIVNQDAVEHWIHYRVPIMHAVLKKESRFQGCEFHYEYWTCGTFSTEATTTLKKEATKTRKFVIAWKDGKAVRDYARKVRPGSVMRVLDQHYFKHPITKIDKNYG